MRNYYLTQRFFVLFFVIVAFFAIGFKFQFVHVVGQMLLFALFGLSFIDIVLMTFPLKAFEYERIVPEKLSNGDANELIIKVKSLYKFKVFVELLEDLPFQFEAFDYRRNFDLTYKELKQLTCVLQPKTRGLYDFGNAYILSKSKLGLIKKRHVVEMSQSSACYPSFLQLRKFEFLAISNKLVSYGLKKVRSVEQNTEFAQIKEYNSGDDYKYINWKASARNSSFYVNQYQAERSQSIYCIIDKGRSMEMPFNGQSLLDYAINSALVLSNVAIKKDDRAGVLSFSRSVEGFVKASSRSFTMSQIINELYKVETNYLESDFGKLYKFLNQEVKSRSLLVLFTNFETYNSYERQEKYIRAIAKKHLLLIVFFENEEVKNKMDVKPQVLHDYYENTISEQLIREKKNISKELKKYGIQSIVTKPENLTVNSINHYLKIRKQGL
jgi:uncharacterized protein (DUF58 family)